LASPLSELPNGASVFIDANVFHFYLRGPEEAKGICSFMLERVEKREITGFTSSLVLDEVMYKMLLKSIEVKFRKNPLEVIQRTSEEIGSQAKQVRKAVDILLGIQNLEVLSVERHHVESSIDYMEKYSMLPRDAIHLAVMKTAECSDVASADSDFDKIPIVKRWTPLAMKMEIRDRKNTHASDKNEENTFKVLKGNERKSKKNITQTV